jgi:UDP-glucose 4-epimerase
MFLGCEMNQFSRALVTGGAGFIGSHLTEELIRRKNEVIILDNLSSGTFDNIPKNKRVTFVQGDIRDTDLMDKLVSNADLIFHLAEFIPNTRSFGSGHVVKYSIDNPLLDFDVSARGTLIILNSVKKHKKRLVFASTAAVYGKVNVPAKENLRPNPVSPYGASKLCAEEYVKLYSRIYGIPATILRLFNVYGPRQTKYVMYDILLKLRKNPNLLSMFGSGKEKRDFIYVKDAVRAFMLVSHEDNAIGQIYNLGTGVSTQISNLVKVMTTILQLDPKVEFLGTSWSGDIPNLVADISKISRIGFTPEYSLKTGLEELIKWFQLDWRRNEGK